MAQQRKLHDKYFKMAKREGYAARSAYKLLEIQKRRSLIRKGNRVLDLGCFPGSWMQVAEKLVGEDGLVVGIDLQEMRIELGPNTRTIVGDFTKTDVADLLPPMVMEQKVVFDLPDDQQPEAELVQPLFNVVMSDMAPSTSGHGDHFFSERLCHDIIDQLPKLLKKNGNCTMKVLEGEGFPELLSRVKRQFRTAGAIKPDACRDVSRETYIFGIGFIPKRAKQFDEGNEKVKPLTPPPGWGE
ncbi:MAG: RlmE family RNA methyltransferase [Phycisphaerales bacterium]|nr:RlmE family RNA methyltransferase [Phycisphaerales bacterium]